MVPGQDREQRWVVDPLDGTTNFLHGLPHFAISIGLERRGELVAGVVYDPIKDELFCAEKGAGAYLNDRRLRVSGRSDLANCLIGTGIPVLELARPRAGLRRAARAAVAARSPGCGGSARPRSTSPTSPPAGWTASGSSA